MLGSERKNVCLRLACRGKVRSAFWILISWAQEGDAEPYYFMEFVFEFLGGGSYLFRFRGVAASTLLRCMYR